MRRSFDYFWTLLEGMGLSTKKGRNVICVPVFQGLFVFREIIFDFKKGGINDLIFWRSCGFQKICAALHMDGLGELRGEFGVLNVQRNYIVDGVKSIVSVYARPYVSKLWVFFFEGCGIRSFVFVVGIVCFLN